ncbi:MAG TPA: hypothetical protein VHQ43_04940 [Solirubrobacterales bacterium]|jgi:hypothetical protein|nr:hypothetical protein [Solirubrobacterales bacterium]
MAMFVLVVDTSLMNVSISAVDKLLADEPQATQDETSSGRCLSSSGW